MPHHLLSGRDGAAEDCSASFFHIGILWNDVMLQHFTLWLAFLGTALATCGKHHISIDVLRRLLPIRLIQLTAIVVDTTSLFIVIVLAYTSIGFLQNEQMGSTTLISNVPLWWAKIIIPFGFILIPLHFVIHITMSVVSPMKGGAELWER